MSLRRKACAAYHARLNSLVLSLTFKGNPALAGQSIPGLCFSMRQVAMQHRVTADRLAFSKLYPENVHFSTHANDAGRFPSQLAFYCCATTWTLVITM